MKQLNTKNTRRKFIRQNLLNGAGTRAILPVHIAGIPCDIEGIMKRKSIKMLKR